MQKRQSGWQLRVHPTDARGARRYEEGGTRTRRAAVVKGQHSS